MKPQYLLIFGQLFLVFLALVLLGVAAHQLGKYAGVMVMGLATACWVVFKRCKRGCE